MRRGVWVIALLVALASVVGLRFAMRGDESPRVAQSTRAERDAAARHADELPALAEDDGARATASDAVPAEASARVAVSAGRVFGVVMNAAGAGLEGADVVLRLASESDDAHTAGPIERTRSDASGRFEFAHEWTPDVRIAATLEGFEECVVAPRPASLSRVMLWSHTLHAEIRGRVVSSRGQPVPGCDITVDTGSEPNSTSPIRGTHVDDSTHGEFTLTVEMSSTGPVRLSVQAHATVGQAERFRDGKSPEFVIVPDAVVKDVVVVLEEASSVLQVIVLEPDGTKIGFSPHIDRIPREGSEDLDSRFGLRPDGSYGVPLFGADSLKALRVTRQDFAPSYVLLPSPNDRENPLTVHMSRGATLSGRVVDSHGEAQQNAQVRAWWSDEPGTWSEIATADANGDYEFQHVPLVDVTLRLQRSADDTRSVENTRVHVDAATVRQDLIVQ